MDLNWFPGYQWLPILLQILLISEYVPTSETVNARVELLVCPVHNWWQEVEADFGSAQVHLKTFVAHSYPAITLDAIEFERLVVQAQLNVIVKQFLPFRDVLVIQC